MKFYIQISRRWKGDVRGKVYLEQHVHDEDLVTLVSKCVETVGKRGEDTNENTNHHYTLEEGTKNCVGTDSHCVAKEKHAKTTENTRQAHENKAEFGLTVCQVRLRSI